MNIGPYVASMMLALFIDAAIVAVGVFFIGLFVTEERRPQGPSLSDESAAEKGWRLSTLTKTLATLCALYVIVSLFVDWGITSVVTLGMYLFGASYMVHRCKKSDAEEKFPVTLMQTAAVLFGVVLFFPITFIPMFEQTEVSVGSTESKLVSSTYPYVETSPTVQKLKNLYDQVEYQFVYQGNNASAPQKATLTPEQVVVLPSDSADSERVEGDNQVQTIIDPISQQSLAHVSIFEEPKTFFRPEKLYVRADHIVTVREGIDSRELLKEESSQTLVTAYGGDSPAAADRYDFFYQTKAGETSGGYYSGQVAVKLIKDPNQPAYVLGRVVFDDKGPSSGYAHDVYFTVTRIYVHEEDIEWRQKPSKTPVVPVEPAKSQEKDKPLVPSDESINRPETPYTYKTDVA